MQNWFRRNTKGSLTSSVVVGYAILIIFLIGIIVLSPSTANTNPHFISEKPYNVTNITSIILNNQKFLITYTKEIQETHRDYQLSCNLFQCWNKTYTISQDGGYEYAALDEEPFAYNTTLNCKITNITYLSIQADEIEIKTTNNATVEAFISNNVNNPCS